MWITLALALVGCSPEPACRADVHAWEDLDADGFGSADLGMVCALTEGQVGQALDCDDTNPEIAPEARERCNQVDDDCDGEIDEDLRLKQYWQDVDGDGFAGAFPSQLACQAPASDWYPAVEDCDDAAADVSPAGVEVCGGGDEDCDGLYDEDDDSIDRESFNSYFRDADGDGSGNPDVRYRGCHLQLGFVANADDCDDTDPDFDYLDLYDDADGDGFGDPGAPTTGCLRDAGKATNGDDCDDSDPDVLSARDWYVDVDGDGWGSGPSQGYGCVAPRPGLVGFGGDCDETSILENPGVPEVCDDGADQNCDLMVDCDDPQCDGDPACQPPCADDTLTGPIPITARGNTSAERNDQTPGCGFSNAPDYVYWFVPDQTRMYTFNTTGSVYDTILYVRSTCGGPDLGCNDDFYGLQSRVQVNLTAGQGVLVHVDGYSNGAGSYVLNIQ